MSNYSSYPSPSQAQLEQIAGAVQASPSPATDYAPPSGNTRKRRADGSTASSRGVANLTPEQLAKKRANDREAQRAIRERTRNQIEGLEKRIKELESQQPFQELQNVIRTRDAVMAENEDLKRRMANILALAQPLGMAQGLADLALATSQQSPLPVQPPQITSGHQHEHGAQYDTPLFNQQHIHPDLRSAPSPRAPQAQMSASPANGQPWSPQHDSRIEVMYHASSDQHPQDSRSPSSTPVWARMPVTSPSTCPLDSILIDFLAGRQRAAAKGATPSSLVGPAYPSIASLLNPARSAQTHPLSQIFTDILTKFPDLREIPEKMATWYIMFLIMRWLVLPNNENYQRLPEWVRPTKSQLEQPHPAWIDHLPWPAMRDRIIQSPKAYPFDSFFIPFTTTLSLNWPYEPGQCLLTSDNQAVANGAAATTASIEALAKSLDEGDEFSINPRFENHLRDLGNWSLGSAFRGAFPDLAEGVRIEDRDA